jgi:Flp pilus assembly protein TadG
MLEFGIISVLLMMTILSIVELSLNVHVRQSAEFAVSAAARVYGKTRSLADAEEEARRAGGMALNRCLATPEAFLFDQVKGEDVMARGAGRVADGSAGDLTATAARLELVCDWRLLSPILQPMLGTGFTFTTTAFVRFR